MKYRQKFNLDIQWETRTAEIRQGDTVVFKQENVRVPSFWSQLATNIVASKYFYGALNSPERESGVDQLVERVVDTVSYWGLQDGYFDDEESRLAFKNDLAYLLLNQYVSFNSPVWFNVGLYHKYGVTSEPCNWYWDKRTNRIRQPENPYEYPQVSACFIQHVDDNMESIMDLARSDAMLFKYGSGSGTNLSTLRASCEGISGGGHSSGPLSFMRIYDQVAEVVTSAGRTRRAALLHCLDINHPDIEQFITCKAEEEKHAKILVERGISPERAAKSVMYQNMNISVRVTDEFMQAVENDDNWETYWVTDKSRFENVYKARALWDKIVQSAWACGDPGLQYDTTINKWNTIPKSGRINASNPCAEFVSIDNTACNLASINLMKVFYRPDMDANKLHTMLPHFHGIVNILIIAQDILIDRASYPLKEIAKNAHRCRQLGLGFTNFGALCMSLGIPYDSDEARNLCGCIASNMTARAYVTSSYLADNLGPFEEYDPVMLDVIENHANANVTLYDEMKDYAQNVWEEALQKGKDFGFRNSQVTLLAPTGTISFMMDCDTTGIEPEIALVKEKQLVGGGVIKKISSSVEKGLLSLRRDPEKILKNLEITGSLMDDLDTNELEVFETALGDNPIRWQAHIEMMAAAQPFLSGAISKTVNLPTNATEETVSEAYKLGWKLGLKSLALYRDNSKSSQPIKVVNIPTVLKVEPNNPRTKLPDTRTSITHRFEINGTPGYFTVGLYPDGQPGELFINMSKEGSTLGGLLDCFGIAVSIGLQYGVPLEVFIEKFAYTRFDPSGWTNNPDIRMAKSIIDYIFRWLQQTFKPELKVEIKSEPEQEVKVEEGITCSNCGSLTARVGTCNLCLVCGTSSGCS